MPEGLRYMKILAIGDIHGLDVWKTIVEKEEYDVCVFVGDYFDSFDVSVKKQIDNFKDIVKFKKNFEEEGDIILLTGNHDLHYLLNDPMERYSGFNHHFMVDIKEALDEATPNMLRAYEAEGFLFTHAGVTKTWCDANGVNQDSPVEDINNLPLEAFGFNHDRDKSNCGEHKSQGPMWVRPQSLKEDIIPIYRQVVGHTRHATPVIDGNPILIDSLWNGFFVTIDTISNEIKYIKVHEG